MLAGVTGPADVRRAVGWRRAVHRLRGR
jgi:hypothetical protein